MTHVLTEFADQVATLETLAAIELCGPLDLLLLAHGLALDTLLLARDELGTLGLTLDTLLLKLDALGTLGLPLDTLLLAFNALRTFLALDAPRTLDPLALLALDLTFGTLRTLNGLLEFGALRPLGSLLLTFDTLGALDPLRTFRPLDLLALQALRPFGALNLLTLDALRAFCTLHLLALGALGTFGALGLLATLLLLGALLLLLLATVGLLGHRGRQCEAGDTGDQNHLAGHE